MSRHLVTTADERSWKMDRPVLFLGEWCRRYDRRQIWTSMDAVLAAPYGLGVGQKVRDVAYVKRVAAALLPDLADALDIFHGTRHGVRYWQIILGHWLLRCVSVVFNRYSTIEQALRDYDISGTTVFAASNYSLATSDSAAFVWACNDDLWNHVLYAGILAHQGMSNAEGVDASLDGIRGFGSAAPPQAQHGRGLKYRVASAVGRILPTLSRENDAVLLSTYLPLKERLKLEMSLGQSPQVWRTPPVHMVAPDAARREGMVVDASAYEGFEQFLRLHLRTLIPSCYLEGYPSLTEQASALPWPSRPAFIFTSNSFDTDEVFKTWTASHVKLGVPYFAGQHGNNYGTHIWGGAECWPERAASDRFITWGWSDDDPRNVPAFLFRTAGSQSPRRKSDGGLLLIEATVSHRIDPHDMYAEFAIYQEEQFGFVEALPEAIRADLTVRLHGEYRNLPWLEELRWLDRSPHTRVETGIAPIKSLMDRSRLVVHSYDSTGILETLALDIPTLCFWQGGLDHLVPSAKPSYELLRSAGILHDTPEAAAAAVALRWDNVSTWWASAAVRHAREAFCERYARTVPHPAHTLRRLLTQAMSACRS